MIARELDRSGATAHHWLSLQRDDDIPARLQRPLVEPLVRFAFRHPVPLTYPLETATYLYAQKRGRSPAG